MTISGDHEQPVPQHHHGGLLTVCSATPGKIKGNQAAKQTKAVTDTLLLNEEVQWRVSWTVETSPRVT